MNVELFSICDSASFDATTRMELRGVHNAKPLLTFPAELDNFMAAFRLRYGVDELGPHHIRIEMFRDDGSLCGPPAEFDIDVQQVSDFPYGWWAGMVAFNAMRVQGASVFHLNLVIDGKLSSTCVLIVPQQLA